MWIAILVAGLVIVGLLMVIAKILDGVADRRSNLLGLPRRIYELKHRKAQMVLQFDPSAPE